MSWADNLADAARDQLAERLPQLIAADAAAQSAGLRVPTTYQQTVNAAALSTASYPAVAVAVPGTTADAVLVDGHWDTSWSLEVGVFDRGRDYNDAQARRGLWSRLLASAIMSRPSLGGISTGIEGFSVDSIVNGDKTTARTVSFSVVTFTVHTLTDLDFAAEPPPPLEQIITTITPVKYLSEKGILP